MLLLDCPHCGPRNASEYRYVGEQTVRPEPAAATPEQWYGYLYLRDNVCGWQSETWYHRAGCRRYFSVERHTLTNQVRPRGGDGDLVPTAGTAAEMGGGTDAATAGAEGGMGA